MGGWNTGKQYVNVDIDRKITSDHHIGHLILESFRKNDPEAIAMINGATNEKETYHSLLNRFIRLAVSLTNYGLKPGDVIALSGKYHLDIRIPYYAGMLNGLPVAGVDPNFKLNEIKTFLRLSKPKIVFCDHGSEENFKKAAEELVLDVTIVTFLSGELSMQKFVDKYDDNTPSDDFTPPHFDPNETYAWLMSTSGTTGVPKLIGVKQKTIPEAIAKSAGIFFCNDNPRKRKQHVCLLLSPVQWASAYLIGTSAILTGVTLLTSTMGDTDHIIDIINKYRPNTAPGSPSIWALIMQSNKPCDLTCFDSIVIGGAKVYKDMLANLKNEVRPDTVIIECYGQAESLGVITCTGADGKETLLGSCGILFPGSKAKIVDPDGNEITEPNVPGELLYLGPMFDGYYNNQEETAKVFTEDGWLRTGDQLYMDEDGNFFFVERLKMILKYRTTHVVPTELEEVIRQHAAVQDVCVSAIDHPTDQQWPVAVVVKKPGAKVTAQEIKDIVAENLSDAKKLRGGVIFVDKLPLTSSGKIARMEVRHIVKSAQRE